jgi:hypothetical protein
MSGTASFTVKATSGTESVTQALSITIASGLTITTTSLPSGTVGTSYNAVLEATGGSGPIAWTLDSGSLSSYGLNLLSSGTIFGTPTTSGTASFTVKAASGTEIATKALSITIASAGSGLTITAHPQSQTKASGERASFSVQATGNGTLLYEWKIWDHVSRQWGDPNPSYYEGVGTDTLTIASVHERDSGDEFYCVVKDSSSSSRTSETATLTVSGGGGSGDSGGGGCDSRFFSIASALLVLFSLLVVWKR